MKELKKQHILISLGRWGISDNIGILVQWNDLTETKVILEMGLDDFPLDVSMGRPFSINLHR